MFIQLRGFQDPSCRYGYRLIDCNKCKHKCKLEGRQVNFCSSYEEYKGEDNMEVNFIEMMKDSFENGTIYNRVTNSGAVTTREYKVIDLELATKDLIESEFKALDNIEFVLVKSMFIKAEQYKEITAEEALKALREGKEIEFEINNMRASLILSDKERWKIKVIKPGSFDWLRSFAVACMYGKFYIKE